MLTSTDRYLGRLIALPLFSTLVIAAMLLVLDKMLRLFDFVAQEGGPVSVVWRMLANLIPEYLSLGIPIGLMLGILLAFRKIAMSSELDVFRAVGMSYGRLLRVPYMYAIGLAVVNLGIVGYVQPYSRYAYEGLRFELRSGALGASIKVGEFTTLKDKMALRIEKSEEDGHRLLGIFARVNSSRGQVLTISAREGRFLALKDRPDTIILRLNDGQIIQDQPGQAPRVLSFSRHDLPIDLPAIEKFRQRGGNEREFLLPQLLKLSWSDRISEEMRNQTRANLNYRMVEVVMMLLLPLLAVSLAVPPKRSTSPLGVFVSIVMVVAYHKVNEYGQAVAALGRVSPALALWGPFVLFSALIVWMYWRVAYVPGGQAIGALERFASGIGKWLRRLLDRRKSGARAA